LGFFLITPFQSLEALEIGISGGINNMTFHPDRVTPHSASTNFKEFQEYPFGFGDLFVRGELSGRLGFNIHVSRDNILQNSLNTMLTANWNYMNLEFGPFAGAGDSLDSPILGITGKLELFFPGIAFLGISGSSSLGSQFDFTSNNTRESAEVKLGFWLQGFIPAFSVISKRYIKQLEDSVVIYDEFLRYQLSADIFIKDFPVSLRLSAGYETLTRSYTRRNSSITDEINALFFGGDIKWQMAQPISITAGFEMPFRYNTVEPMTKPQNALELFKFRGGVVYTFY
jgi:hypothetical protein